MKKQRGYIYRRAGWWVLRYRENLLEGGQIVRKQLAKQLAEIAPEHSRLKRPPKEIEDMAEKFLRPTNDGETKPEQTQTIGHLLTGCFSATQGTSAGEHLSRLSRTLAVTAKAPMC